jgi:hypothetical protein
VDGGVSDVFDVSDSDDASSSPGSSAGSSQDNSGDANDARTVAELLRAPAALSATLSRELSALLARAPMSVPAQQDAVTRAAWPDSVGKQQRENLFWCMDAMIYVLDSQQPDVPPAVASLKHVRNDVAYMAPEMLQTAWNAWTNALRTLPRPLPCDADLQAIFAAARDRANALARAADAGRRPPPPDSPVDENGEQVSV